MSPSTSPQDYTDPITAPSHSAPDRHDDDDHVHTHWASRAAFPLIVLGLVLSQVALGVTAYHSVWWLAVPLMLLVSHFHVPNLVSLGIILGTLAGGVVASLWAARREEQAARGTGD